MKSKFKRFSPEWWEWMTVPEPNSGCLLWTGNVCKSGYGRVAYSPNGSSVLVHRIALSIALGHPISSGMKVLHRCDTPSCVNPDHLYLGTQKDNMRDMFAKGRARPHGSGTPVLRLTRTVSAPLAVRELASTNSNESVRMADVLHHIRTSGMQAGWRHVTGVPALPEDHDGPACLLSSDEDGKPARSASGGLRTVATVALGCALMLLSACQSSTSYGRCIGLNQDPDSTLRYEYSARNIVWGVVGVEFIAPPIVVGLNKLRCPVARRPSAGGRQP